MKTFKNLTFLAILFVAMSCSGDKKANNTAETKDVTAENKAVTSKAVPTNNGEKVYVLIETDYGNMKALLYNETPKHRDNFAKLAKEGFYTDLLFHRVIQGFMIQGGDPKSKNAGAGQSLGSGGPGYRIDAEIGQPHFKGTLAAARTGGPSNPEKMSSGSQFYIVHGKPINKQNLDNLARRKNITYTDEQIAKYEQVGGTAMLDGDYTVFGQVVEGLDVIDKIAAVQTNGRDRPDKDVKMKITLL